MEKRLPRLRMRVLKRYDRGKAVCRQAHKQVRRHRSCSSCFETCVIIEIEGTASSYLR